MKVIVVAAILGSLVVGGCSGGNGGNNGGPKGVVADTTTTVKVSKAHKLYDAFVKKYGSELKELDQAYGGTNLDHSFEAYAPTACEPEEPGAAGTITMIMGPILAKHGHNPIEFINEARAVDVAVKAEGYCQ